MFIFDIIKTAIILKNRFFYFVSFIKDGNYQMQLEWLGENRELIAALYRAANAFSQIYKKEMAGEKVLFCSYEIQIMEHIMENENQNMKTYALSLGMSTSTMTKTANKMVKKGLLEKYHIKGNRKDVVLKVSPLGMEEYKKYSLMVKDTFFKELFEKLDSYSPETKEAIKEFLTIWGNACFELVNSNSQNEDIELERIE